MAEACCGHLRRVRSLSISTSSVGSGPRSVSVTPASSVRRTRRTQRALFFRAASTVAADLTAWLRSNIMPARP